MIVDKACFERGCACYDDRVDGPGVEVVEKKGEKPMSIEAMKQALEALEWNLPVIEDYGDKEQLNRQHKAITALRQAIEQAEKQEPVAFASHGVINWIADKQFQHEADLYTAPQPQSQREWVGLTDEERKDLCRSWSSPMDAIYATEAKLKEKNQ
jgi:hypothetical protein